MSKVIMSADDSASIRQMISSTLKKNGYEVIEAVDGKDALEKLHHVEVDMLISDLNMPNLNGIGLVRAARTIPACKFIPIIMLTTESDTSKKQEGKAAGVTGWLLKPFTSEQLMLVVNKVLG
jgi:two-component system chemotaxis response regulator CheY